MPSISGKTYFLTIALCLCLLIMMISFKQPPACDSTNNGSKSPMMRVVIGEESSLGAVMTRTKSMWKINSDICTSNANFILARLKIPPNTPIFVYPAADDNHVSGAILKRGDYEGEWVQKIYPFLKRNHKAVFIDIGANIGMYSITLAALGHRVISIDVLDDNVKRLCASMKAAKLTDKMTIIYNAVSDRHENITLGRYPKDVGGTFVKHIVNEGDKTVETIRLDDLLEIYDFEHAVIKMDVEKSEDRVLKGAYNFFKKVKVDALLLEFIKHKNEDSGRFIVEFLSSFGLQPQVPSNVKNDYRKWTINNIIFTRQN